jgi:methionyl-tRNA formyltransferase
MSGKKRLKVCFMGGRQAGIVGALAILAKGNDIIAAVSYSEDLTYLLKLLGITVYKSVRDADFVKKLKSADLLFSIHGKEWIPPKLLKLPRMGSVNLHPYLYKYKGANPVDRAIKDGERKASVGAHIMEEKIDEGKVLLEEFVDITGANSVCEVYNKLYPYYCRVTLKTLDIMNDKWKKNKK